MKGCGLRFALFGDPIGHSLSPAMHRAAYASMGFTASMRHTGWPMRGKSSPG